MFRPYSYIGEELCDFRFDLWEELLSESLFQSELLLRAEPAADVVLGPPLHPLQTEADWEPKAWFPIAQREVAAGDCQRSTAPAARFLR